METFEQVIARLSGATENPLPADITAELTGAFTHEIGIREAAISDREAKITAAENLVKEKDQEAIRLKAVNYDLLQAAKVPAPDADNTDNTDNTSDDAPKGIASMFREG